VREALDHAKATKVRPGWVRGGEVATVEMLSKCVELQDENAELKKQIAAQTRDFVLPDGVAGLDERLDLGGSYSVPVPREIFNATQHTKISTTYAEIFELIAPHLMAPVLDSHMSNLIFRCVWRKHHGEDRSVRDFETCDEDFQSLKIQFSALELVLLERDEAEGNRSQLYWSLTHSGEQEMYRRRIALVKPEI
jgi:hypothetical protein